MKRYTLRNDIYHLIHCLFRFGKDNAWEDVKVWWWGIRNGLNRSYDSHDEGDI